MPDGIAAARRLGLDLGAAESFPFRGIRFCHRGRFVDGRFPDGVGLGIRRTTLHETMIARAEEVGVDARWGARVAFEQDRVLVNGSPVAARWIVGGDGINSAVRSWAGLNSCARSSRRFGFRRHYQIEPWSEFMELHWGQGCQLYITPVGACELCVVLISRDQRLRLDDALAGFPEVAQRLRGAGAVTSERGGVSATRRLHSVCNSRVGLIGDASGSVDAITGEGLCLLFQQAVALAGAMEAGDLSLYAAAHRRIGRRPEFMANLMLMFDRRARLRSAVMKTLLTCPQLFSGMIRFHVRQTA